MSVHRRRYDPDFKRNAVQLTEEPGRTVIEVTTDHRVLELKCSCTRRTILKSLVRENRMQGSARGRSGN